MHPSTQPATSRQTATHPLVCIYGVEHPPANQKEETTGREKRRKIWYNPEKAHA
jgi:hypothetical protein